MRSKPLKDKFLVNISHNATVMAHILSNNAISPPVIVGVLTHTTATRSSGHVKMHVEKVLNVVHPV